MTIVGLIPCGGKAERLHGLPKYLMPIPGSTYALDEMCRKLYTVEGLNRVCIGAGLHNQCIVEQYAPAGSVVYRANSRTMCEGLIEGRRYTGDSNVIMAMADAFFTDETVLGKMAAELSAGADCVIACWMTRPDQRSSLGMVAWDKRSGELLEIDDKPARTALTHAWGAVAWSTAFWQYIKAADSHLGLALNRSAESGLSVKVVIADGDYHDLGTIDSVTRFYAQFEKVGVK